MIEVRSDDLVSFTGVTKEFALSSGSFTAIQHVSVQNTRDQLAQLGLAVTSRGCFAITPGARSASFSSPRG